MKLFVTLVLVGSLIALSGFVGATAEISDGISLSGTTVSTVSNRTDMRNVVIQMTNYLDIPLYTGGHYTCSNVRTMTGPPVVVQSKTREVAQFEGKGFSSSGVISFRIGEGTESLTLALVFSQRRFSRNWFGLKWISNRQVINQEFYDTMYNDDAWNNPSDWANYGYAEKNDVVIRLSGYTATATMTNQYKSVIFMEIRKNLPATQQLQPLLA